MFARNIFDLPRIDVVASADDQFLGPSDDADVAVGLEAAEVSGSKPSVFGKRLRVDLGTLPIAFEDIWTTDLNLV